MWQSLTKQSDLDLFPVNRFCSSVDVPIAICIYSVSNIGFHRQEKNKKLHKVWVFLEYLTQTTIRIPDFITALSSYKS